MKEKFYMIKMSFILARMFFIDFYKIAMKEIKDEKAYRQELYPTCLDRSKAMIGDAIKRAINFYACSIINHRITEHDDTNLESEQKEIEAKLTTKEIKQAKAGFWMPS